jgi:hypothetical protein
MHSEPEGSESGEGSGGGFAVFEDLGGRAEDLRVGVW